MLTGLRMLLLFALFGFPSAATAQYRFDIWTTDNGLPHNSIRGLLQTRDGYLWVTTVNGAARFFNKSNTPGITTNSFSFLAMWEDRRGTLWMGTADGGVIRYRDGRFSALTTQDGLPSNYIERIDEDEGGVVWIFTEGGLAQWKDERLVRVAPAPGSPFNDCLSSPREYLGVDAHLFGLWRMNASGWQRFAYGRWTPLPLPPRLTDPTKVRAYYMFEDARRNLWFGLKDRESETYLVKDGRLSIVQNKHPASRSFICYQDSQGRFWSGSPVGLNGFLKDGRFTALPEFVTSNVFKVLEDREGGLWIGTFFEGLCRLKEPFITFHRPAGGGDYKTAKTSGAMIEDSRGDVWLRSAALARFRDGRFTNYFRPGRTRKAWDWGNLVSALYEDHDGSIWIGTWDGVTRFRDGRLLEESVLSEQIKGRVHAILRDRDGNLWFGMESGGGLYRLRDGAVTHYTTGDGLAGDAVNVIHQDRAGGLWIGTNHGLSRFTGAGFETPKAAEELSLTAVKALHEDVNGVIWIGTHDRGLYRLNAAQDGMKLTRYTTMQGLQTDRVDVILEDDTSYVWMACNLGLIRVRKQELEDFAGGRVSSVISTLFSKQDGLVNEENHAYAEPVGYGFKARDGRLWFATRQGIAVVDPRAVPFNPTPPPVLIEEGLVDSRPAEFQDELRVNAKQENLEIQYTALSLVKSDQIRFRYKMEGLDREWVEAGARRAAYYPHIPSGDFVFKVIAANSDGVWNLQGQSLRVVVLPPFYRAWWFLTLASLAGAALVWLAFRFRLRQLDERNAQQEAFSRELIESQEAERKRIAAELHDGLGQNLIIIKNWAALGLRFTEPAEPVRAQLQEISSTASQSLQEVREIISNLRPHQLETVGLTRTLTYMCEQAAQAAGLQLRMEIAPLDGVFAPENEVIFYRLVQEGLNNIIKHAQAERAEILIERRAGELHLKIEDDGRGFDPASQMGGRGQTGRLRGGFGLKGLAERARQLGGGFQLQSAPGRGVKIHITIQEGADER
jgi:signal transduction histidine kinase/ligand-binding sensor domain-containing protein